MKTPFTLLKTRLLAAAISFIAAVSVSAATFTVTNTNDSGMGSLRGALISAISSSAPGQTNTIEFDIPGSGVKTIRPISQFPQVFLPADSRLVIAGTSQPGYAGSPLIELSGEQTEFLEPNGFDPDVPVHGLDLRQGTLEVRGLIINRFSGDGVHGQCQGSGISAPRRIAFNIKSCWIGTTATGIAAAGNAGFGIAVYTSEENGPCYFGGINTGDGNVISGNGTGVLFDITPDLNLSVASQTSAWFYQNKIGTGKDGSTAVGNRKEGILISSSEWNISDHRLLGAVQIGRFGAGGGNVISGNLGNGVEVEGAMIQMNIANNIIGLNAAGTAALGNAGDGIVVGSDRTIVGGTSAADGNTISGNGQWGVRVLPIYSGDTEDALTFLGWNRIGTDLAGNSARGNQLGGVFLDAENTFSEPEAVIGTITAPNVICGNHGAGIELDGDAEVIGNHIGVTYNGVQMGNNGPGILSTEWLVARRNVVGANAGHGIHLTRRFGNGSYFQITDNWIGLTTAGAPAGNAGDGIHNAGGQAGGLIGLTQTDPGNRIAWNTGAGIAIPNQPGTQTDNCSILGNSIWANGGLGIDLGSAGVSPNDTGDLDGGANSGMNMPVITSVSLVRAVGYLKSHASERYRIEFFKADPDASGYGEGRWYLGALEVMTNVAGHADFVNPLALAPGDNITATATRLNDESVSFYPIAGSSEFSRNVTVSAEHGNLEMFTTAANAAESVGALAFTVRRTGTTNGSVTVNYTTANVTAMAGSDYGVKAGTLTFPHGTSALTVYVPIVNDITYEQTETFRFSIYEPAGGAAITGVNTAIATITDDDFMPSFEIQPGAQIIEGTGGTTMLTMTVNLSSEAVMPASVNWATANTPEDTADAPQDYTSVSGTLNFPAGVISRTFSIPIAGDMLAESTETISVVFSSPNGALLPVTTALAVILDDDTPGTLQFSPAADSISEGEGSRSVTIVRNGGSNGTVTVNLTASGTAVPGSDYQAIASPQTITFQHGETSRAIIVSVLDDNIVEPDKTVVLQMSNPLGGAVLGAQAVSTITILDDDVAPFISGHVLKAGGVPLAGATLTLNGPVTQIVTTDANGAYSFPNLAPGTNCTVSVSLEGWTFTPSQRSYLPLNSSTTQADFTGVQEVLPELHMSSNPDNTITLYWDLRALDWGLETSSTLAADSWQPVDGVTQTITWKSVTLPASQRAFFRLVKISAEF